MGYSKLKATDSCSGFISRLLLNEITAASAFVVVSESGG